MPEYTSAGVYIDSCASLEAKLTAIDNLIAALETQELALAESDSPITEYMLNDGETTIKTTITSSMQIRRTLEILERRRNITINKLNGRVTRGVDSKNFTGYGDC